MQWPDEIEQLDGNIADFFSTVEFPKKPVITLQDNDIKNSSVVERNPPKDLNVTNEVIKQEPVRVTQFKKEEKMDNNDDDDDSGSEELILAHDYASLAPRMRTDDEMHIVCLDRWDDLYPEDSPPSGARKFEDDQIKHDAAWFQDKPIFSTTEPIHMDKNDDSVIPVGIVKNFGIALKGPFIQDKDKGFEELNDIYTDHMKADLKEAWDATTIGVLSGYVKIACERGALDAKHARILEKAFSKQKKLIAIFAEKLNDAIAEAKCTEEDQAELVDELKAQYEHPSFSKKVAPRLLDSMTIHGLSISLANIKGVPCRTYTAKKPLEEFIKTIREKDAARIKKNKKRKAQKKKKRNQKKISSKGKEEEEEEEEEDAVDRKTKEIVSIPVDIEKPSPRVKGVKSELLICPFGAHDTRHPIWKQAKHHVIETTGVTAIHKDGDIVVSTDSGVSVHRVPSGVKIEEYHFPGDWHGEIKQLFINPDYICCVFATKNGFILYPCKTLVINRNTGKALVIATTTRNYATSICMEPGMNSVWIGSSNGTAVCLNLTTLKLEDRVNAVAILPTDSPVLGLRRVGRQLHCHVICGIHSIDIKPMKNETIQGMMERAGNPVMSRFSMPCSYDRRGTLRIVIQRDHSISIAHSAMSVVKVIVPPDQFITRTVMEVEVDSEDGKGKIREEMQVIVPVITPFILNQHVRLDEDKLVIIYSDGTLQVVHTVPKTEKEKLAETVNLLKRGIAQPEKRKK